MTPNDAALMNGIELDIQACQELLALLDKEQVLLTERDFPSLDKLIEDKGRLLIQLDRNAVTRSQWAASYGASAGGAATQDSKEETFSRFVLDKGLAERWQELKNLMVECQTANEANGKMMVRSQSTHHRLLNILRGQQQSSQLYNGKGGKQTGLSRNTLGQA